MRTIPFGKTGIALSQIALGGHEFLASGLSRGFNEDFAKAVTAGYIVPGFGGPKRVKILKTAYDAAINIFDVTIDAEKEALLDAISRTSLRPTKSMCKPGPKACATAMIRAIARCSITGS